MSYDRVLPAPVAVRHESSGSNFLHSNPFEHKIMNDLPMSHRALPHRPEPLAATCRYPEYRPNAVPQIHQQMAMYHSKAEPYTPPIDKHPIVDAYPRQHSISKASLPLRERSPPSSGSSSPAKSGKEEYASQWCLCKPDPKIPRPRNAFILYRQHHQAAVVSHNPGLANPEISKIIGMQWRALTEGEKNKWRALAEEEKARHAQQYPTYRYQPKRAGRDGNNRHSGSGISHNPSGASTCNSCGGRIMNAPTSPMTPFTPTGRSASISGLVPGRATTTIMSARSSHGGEKELKPIKIDQIDHRVRPRRFDDADEQSPDLKRRRVSHASIKSDLPVHRNRSPDSISPYSMSPYQYNATIQQQQQQRQPLPSISRPFNNSPPVPGQPAGSESSLKLAPLKTSTPINAPLTPFSQDGSNASVEATVMTIPYLNKIKVLAKISPPLQPTFRQTPVMRGPIIAIDGQDPALVQSAVNYLERMFKKEAKHHVRIFQGPTIKDPTTESSSDPTVEYLDTISSWHRVSDEVKDFVRTLNGNAEFANANTSEALTREDGLTSPKTLIPKTNAMHINSPPIQRSRLRPLRQHKHIAHSATASPSAPISTDDGGCIRMLNSDSRLVYFSRSLAVDGESLADLCGTGYHCLCSREELERFGGNAVEMRLQDARTIVIRKILGSPGVLEEKALKRVGFEIEDFLTQ
ncbi:hypothetical protein N7481_003263 [Penicillium waksmanii]|uniref:uncharacterized protein n=1 Tax=Penicillium waksmanii TaxID=69791 RepID=UPI00254734AE|nr:uncharacterized protein N7481_003263 [Penicillium waksmanii]KAJ5988053.1 hypothetical protein N7481_003263 [Penicillium waksmanii]